MSFAENFRNARLAANLTQQQIADELGLDRTTIAKYESGNSTPNFNNIPKICEKLNLTLDELFKAGEDND